MPISRSHNFGKPRSSFEFPSYIKVRSVPKELLHLCHHHQCWASTHVPHDSLLLVSSDALILLVSYVCKLHCSILRLCKPFAGSQDWPCNFKIGTQFPDSENVQRNLKIAQIPRLHRTHILHTLVVCVCAGYMCTPAVCV